MNLEIYLNQSPESLYRLYYFYLVPRRFKNKSTSAHPTRIHKFIVNSHKTLVPYKISLVKQQDLSVFKVKERATEITEFEPIHIY